MSGLAQMLAGRGGTVSGSEETSAPSPRAGVRGGSAPGHVGRAVELLVYAPGVSRAHPERLRAARLGVPQVSGPQLLDRLMGTHRPLRGPDPDDPGRGPRRADPVARGGDDDLDPLGRGRAGGIEGWPGQRVVRVAKRQEV